MASGPVDRDGAADVDAYLEGVQAPHRATLETLRAMLRSTIPRADECLSYGMPTFVLDGKGVAAYAAFKQHCSYFPMSSSVITMAGSALDHHSVSKGAVRFAVDRPLPGSIVRRLVKLRLAELSDVRTGARIDYFDDGTIKAQGRMKDGELHGPWRWFRQDGSLMRSGRFDRGRQVGTWQTWDRNGNLVRETTF